MKSRGNEGGGIGANGKRKRDRKREVGRESLSEILKKLRVAYGYYWFFQKVPEIYFTGEKLSMNSV